MIYVSFILTAYAYVIYPISVYVLALIIKRRINNNVENKNKVSIIVAVHNEEKRIKDKINNLLSVDYEKGSSEIIVVSDGSTDGTQEIVNRFHGKGVDLLSIPERKGKENAQKEALKQARGEVVVFTDVGTLLDKHAIRRIVSNFADPSVGCVSSVDRIIGKDGNVSGEGFYVRYEMWLRKLESRVSSPVGLSGSFFAARKSVCEDFSTEMDSDFRVLLNSVKQGMRGTIDEQAIGYYQDLSDQKKEFDRKVRTVLRGLTLFFKSTEFLNFFKYGLFSYQLFCHKLLRWMVPFFLIILFAVNIPLALMSDGYAILLVVQCGFYGLAVVSLFRDWYSSRMILLKIPAYFVTVNASILVAWFRYLTGQRILVWTPSER